MTRRCRGTLMMALAMVLMPVVITAIIFLAVPADAEPARPYWKVRCEGTPYSVYSQSPCTYDISGRVTFFDNHSTTHKCTCRLYP